MGDTVKEVIANTAPVGQKADAFGASFILGGQIKGTEAADIPLFIRRATSSNAPTTRRSSRSAR